MPRDGTATRERILDVATDIAMDRGFAAASLDEVLGQSGVTKGAFYHYFDSKADLGRAILDRYAAADLETLDRLWTQAEQLSRDPLQQLLLFVGLFANLDELATDDPGCLYATFIYERQLGVDGAIDVIEASIRAWRDRFRAKLDEVVERYPPRLDVDLDALSDLVFSTSEGAYIVARATRDPALVRGQLLQVRAYLELLFAPAPVLAPPRSGRGSGASERRRHG
jgi:TetR/AcrR family transcriptional regulator, transcriptional repressor for nem operon